VIVQAQTYQISLNYILYCSTVKLVRLIFVLRISRSSTTETGQSCGFGFVTMSTFEKADKAIEMFNRYVSSFLSFHLLLLNRFIH
jgi:RNA recognition motif-containing protein